MHQYKFRKLNLNR